MNQRAKYSRQFRQHSWAEWVAEFSPLKHFIEIMRQVLMKGAGPLDIWQPTVILAGYGGVVLSVAVRQYSKTKAGPSIAPSGDPETSSLCPEPSPLEPTD